jgi:hypothetical protein
MLGYLGLSEYDTTGAQPGADWRVYLAFHPVARQIIGDDVYRFEVGSLGAWDANMEQRREDFKEDRGLRERARACAIDKTPRKNERPSDHTPVVLTLD